MPVCVVQTVSHCLGGAGNVANNLASFGANITLMGMMGNDDMGRIMTEKLTTAGISLDGLIVRDNYKTICKTRVLAQGQQLCRIDQESIEPVNMVDVSPFLSSLDAQTFDAVIISDYKKGMIRSDISQPIIQWANSRHIPVIVDPKDVSMMPYKGATLLTPNMREFKDITGVQTFRDDDHMADVARSLIQSNGISYVLVTRSQDGMSLFSMDSAQHFPTKAREIFDVSGAGDTVIAALAYYLGAKQSVRDAVRFANAAAGVVVSKIGTATATIQEIDAYHA